MRCQFRRTESDHSRIDPGPLRDLEFLLIPGELELPSCPFIYPFLKFQTCTRSPIACSGASYCYRRSRSRTLYAFHFVMMMLSVWNAVLFNFCRVTDLV